MFSLTDIVVIPRRKPIYWAFYSNTVFVLTHYPRDRFVLTFFSFQMHVEGTDMKCTSEKPRQYYSDLVLKDGLRAQPGVDFLCEIQCKIYMHLIEKLCL